MLAAAPKSVIKGFLHMLSGLHHHLSKLLSRSRTHRRLLHDDGDLLSAVAPDDPIDEPTAYAVLLTELALADGSMDRNEEKVIEEALGQMPGVRPKDVPILMDRARSILNSFRGPFSFVSRIKREYSQQEREKLFVVIDKLIKADGVETAYEQYLREKFHALLQ